MCYVADFFENFILRVAVPQLQRLQEIFDRHDADGSGEIDVHELRAAMKELGTELTLVVSYTHTYSHSVYVCVCVVCVCVRVF